MPRKPSVKKRDIYLNNPNLPAVDAQFEYTPEMVQEIQRCKDDLIHFASNYFYIINPDSGRQVIKLHDFQTQALNMIHDNRFNILLFSRQVGKALALDTPVPTPKGWTTMGAIKAGDQVYGSSGEVCNVTHAHDVLMNRECYEMVFDSGERIIADGEHQWFTQSAKEDACGQQGSVKTTHQLAAGGGHRIASPQQVGDAKIDRSWHYIKSVTPVKSVPVRCISVDSKDNLFLIGKHYIPTHNTTISTIYLLWHAIFNSDQHILVVANKEETAKEIFGRVQLAFEELPNWLKGGVKEYGKEGMQLANGSKIKITTTTSTAGRGSACNVLFIDEADHVECVSGDTMITLRDTSINEIIKLTIAKAHTLQGNHEVLTKDGFKKFDSIQRYANRKAVVVEFDDNTCITTSPDHMLKSTAGKFVVAEKSRYRHIQTIDGAKKVISVRKLKEKVDLYDVCDVEGHEYITNGIVSHNCNLLNSFWASVFPIISASKKSKIIMASTPRDTSGIFYRLYKKSISDEPGNVWRSMVVRWHDVPGRDESWAQQARAGMDDPTRFKVEFECEFEETGDATISDLLFEKMRRRCSDPIHVYMDGQYKLWDEPNRNHLYVVGVDVAEGVGQDNTVVQVLDITDLRQINQVATFASNTITPAEFTPKLYEILQQWGLPLLMSERNSCGAQVVDNLRKDFQYEGIVSYGARELGRSKIPLGVISHSNTKYDCIQNKRYWINTMDAVQINDIKTVEELKDFIKYPNGSWKARHGKHDDRVMSLGWGLMILSEKIVHKYFEVISQDENHRAAVIKPLDFGVKYFINPSSMYVDEVRGDVDVLPSLLGNTSFNADIDDLQSMGWQFLR